MFILPLIVYVFVVFLVLWTADFYLTFKCVKKLGKEIELNPIIKLLFRVRGSRLFVYKLFEIVIFSGLTYYVSLQSGPYMLSILYGLIFVYSLIVAQGLHVFNQAYSNIKPALVLFVFLVLYLIFCINLNFSLFYNTMQLSTALGKCNSEYVAVYSECKGTAPPMQFDLNKYNLDLVIPGVVK